MKRHKQRRKMNYCGNTSNSPLDSHDKRSVSANMKTKNNATGNKRRFLKPGALAQLRDAKMNARASALSESRCTAIGRKRVLVREAFPGREVDYLKSNEILSPQRKVFVKQVEGPASPATPPKGIAKFAPFTPPVTFTEENLHDDSESGSRLEFLPFDLQVKILCFLHHDELKPVFQVSKKLGYAALVARQSYFNYRTPNRHSQEMLKSNTLCPKDHRPFSDEALPHDGCIRCPVTPKAPRHDQRPPSRLTEAEMKQISARLFQGPSPQEDHGDSPGLPFPGASKQLSSNRVLFCKDELCQAVAQNRLL